MAIDLNKETLCFKVFHISNDSYTSKKRRILKDELDMKISAIATELDTPTIGINTIDSAIKFYKNNKDVLLNPKGMDLYINDRYTRKAAWRLGELGIWATNITAWQNFLNSNFEYAIFMEDDFQVNDHFINNLKTYVQELPEDWEFFSPYVNTVEYINYFNNPEKYNIGNQTICKSYHALNLTCYLINKKFAEKILRIIKENAISVPPDVYLLQKKEDIPDTFETYVSPENFNTYCLRPGVYIGCRCIGADPIIPSTYFSGSGGRGLDLSDYFNK